MKKKPSFMFWAVLAILLLVGMYGHLVSGATEIAPTKIAKLLYQKMIGQSWGEDAILGVILWNGRIPRLLVAFLVGASLSVAGGIMQGIFKNPMASPDVTGVASASVLGAVLSLILGASQRFFLALPFFAITSAILMLLLVYFVSTFQGKTSIVTLLLVGMASSLFCASAVAFLITIHLNEWEVGKTIVAWTLGDLNDRQWEHVWIVTGSFLISLIFILYYARDLNILMHGEELALNLGVEVARVRFFLLFSCAFLTGGAIGVAGLIGFVGLIIPHICRVLAGNDNQRLILGNALLGGVFLLYCDLLIRLTTTVDLKIGTATGMIGAPYFFWLVLKNKKKFLYL